MLNAAVEAHSPVLVGARHFILREKRLDHTVVTRQVLVCHVLMIKE